MGRAEFTSLLCSWVWQVMFHLRMSLLSCKIHEILKSKKIHLLSSLHLLFMFYFQKVTVHWPSHRVSAHSSSLQQSSLGFAVEITSFTSIECIDKLQTLIKSLLSAVLTLILGDFNVNSEWLPTCSSLEQQPLAFGRSVVPESRASPKCNKITKLSFYFYFVFFFHCCRIHIYTQSLLFFSQWLLEGHKRSTLASKQHIWSWKPRAYSKGGLRFFFFFHTWDHGVSVFVIRR